MKSQVIASVLGIAAPLLTSAVSVEARDPKLPKIRFSGSGEKEEGQQDPVVMLPVDDETGKLAQSLIQQLPVEESATASTAATASPSPRPTSTGTGTLTEVNSSTMWPQSTNGSAPTAPASPNSPTPTPGAGAFNAVSLGSVAAGIVIVFGAGML